MYKLDITRRGWNPCQFLLPFTMMEWVPNIHTQPAWELEKWKYDLGEGKHAASPVTAPGQWGELAGPLQDMCELQLLLSKSPTRFTVMALFNLKHTGKSILRNYFNLVKFTHLKDTTAYWNRLLESNTRVSNSPDLGWVT